MSHSSPAPRRDHWGRYSLLLILASLGLAALTLLVLPRTFTYDPMSWLLWGRELVHGHLDTRRSSTATKPLPTLLIALLTPTGHARLLWMVIARSGVFWAPMLAFRLARRLWSGRAPYAALLAGTLAAVAVLLLDQWDGYLFVSGMSEPLTAALLLAAVDAHWVGRHRGAFVMLVLVGLLRPEAWLFVLAYAGWLAWRGHGVRRLLPPVIAVLVVASWFAIDWIGSHELSRSALAAQEGNAGGPLLSKVPGLAAIAETVPLLSVPVIVLFVLGIVTAVAGWWRTRRPPAQLWLALIAFAWMGQVVVLTQMRAATGAPRYMIPAAGLACVVAGAFPAQVAVWLRERSRRRGWPAALRAAGGVVLGVAAVAALVLAWLPRVHQGAEDLRKNAHAGWVDTMFERKLPAAVRVAGGRGAILRCGPVWSGPYEVPLLAYQLRVPAGQIHSTLQKVPPFPHAPGTMILRFPGLTPHPLPKGFRRLTPPPPPDQKESRDWTVFSTCHAPAH